MTFLGGKQIWGGFDGGFIGDFDRGFIGDFDRDFEMDFDMEFDMDIAGDFDGDFRWGLWEELWELLWGGLWVRSLRSELVLRRFKGSESEQRRLLILVVRGVGITEWISDSI